MSESQLIEAALTADRPRALPMLFAASAVRPAALALILLNAELARIPATVDDATAGLFRFQFWRDAVLGNGTPANVWIEPLREALAKGLWQSDDIDRLIDARATLLDGFEGQSVSGIATFCERTSGALQQLLARLATSEGQLIERAGHAGTAYGLVGIRPAIANQLHHGRLHLPSDMLQNVGWGRSDSASEIIADRLAEATKPLLDLANDEIVAWDSGPAIPRELFFAMCQARIARWQLVTQRQNPDRLTADADTLPHFWAFYLWLRRVANRP